jgi:hypothetical protein
VRERTRYAIRAALGILVVMPAIWLAVHFIARAFWWPDYKPDPFLIIMLMVVFGGLAIYNFATYREDNDGSA